MIPGCVVTFADLPLPPSPTFLLVAMPAARMTAVPLSEIVPCR